MMTKIEEVARALWDRHNRNVVFAGAGPTKFDDLPASDREYLFEQARAAMVAMRGATMTMRMHGAVEYAKTSNSAIVWDAMIDAALGEA